jgi:hypothetical protein
MYEPEQRHQEAPAPSAGLAGWMRLLATWRVWLPLAIGYAGFAAVFFATRAPFAVAQVQAMCGQPAPDMRFTSSAAEIHTFLHDCGVAGRDAYRALQLADLVYPLLFAVFLASSLAMVLTRLARDRPSLAVLAALPLLAGAFDYLENACAWAALTTFPEPAATDGLLGLATAAKSVTSWFVGLLLLALLAALGVVRVGRWRARRARADAGFEVGDDHARR